MGHRSHHESTSACTLVDVAAPNSFFMVICSHIVEICWHMDITVQSYHKEITPKPCIPYSSLNESPLYIQGDKLKHQCIISLMSDDLICQLVDSISRFLKHGFAYWTKIRAARSSIEPSQSVAGNGRATPEIKSFSSSRPNLRGRKERSERTDRAPGAVGLVAILRGCLLFKLNKP